MFPIDSRMVQLDDVPIHYARCGGGQPLVLLHKVLPVYQLVLPTHWLARCMLQHQVA